MSQHKKPSLLVRGGNLLTSLAHAGKHFLETGEVLVEEEEFLDRINICRTNKCERYSVDEDGDECLECGCYLNIKAWGAGFTCPLLLWPGDVEKTTGELHEQQEEKEKEEE